MSKWDTVEGGALPGADGPIEVEITGASFNYDAAYNDGDTLVFILEGDCDHEYWQDSIIYSIGNGWDTDDNVIVTGRDGFGKQTNYAAFFQAVMATKAGTLIKKRDKAGSGEGPGDASIYEGLIFEFERLPYEGFDKEEKFRLIPTKFVGEAGKAKAKGKPKAKKVGKKELRRKLVKLAGKFSDHDEFVEAVLDKFPQVEDMEDLYDEVLDEDGIFDE